MKGLAVVVLSVFLVLLLVAGVVSMIAAFVIPTIHYVRDEAHPAFERGGGQFAFDMTPFGIPMARSMVSGVAPIAIVVIGLALVFLLIPLVLLYFVVRLLRGSGEDRRKRQEEGRMAQELYALQKKLDERMESLETILFSGMKKE